jgi:hypothetical protein
MHNQHRSTREGSLRRELDLILMRAAHGETHKGPWENLERKQARSSQSKLRVSGWAVETVRPESANAGVALVERADLARAVAEASVRPETSPAACSSGSARGAARAAPRAGQTRPTRPPTYTPWRPPCDLPAVPSGWQATRRTQLRVSRSVPRAPVKHPRVYTASAVHPGALPSWATGDGAPARLTSFAFPRRAPLGHRFCAGLKGGACHSFIRSLLLPATSSLRTSAHRRRRRRQARASSCATSTTPRRCASTTRAARSTRNRPQGRQPFGRSPQRR